MRRTRSYRNRKTYQNRGQKTRLKLSRSTGRIRKALTAFIGRRKFSSGFSARLGWQGKMQRYKNLKRKRYYKRNLSY